MKKCCVSILLLLFSTSSWARQECLKCCSELKSREGTFLVQKLQKGIPIEVLSLVRAGDAVLCMRPLQLRYSYWTKKVIAKSQHEELGFVPIEQSLALICQHMLCEPSVQGENLTLMVLLNPLWEGRFARVTGRVNKEGGSLLNIDWKRIFKGYPAEKVLLDMPL
ncbi:MAG TPA: hypothetical protein VE954_01845 [Oligoflexus sp.]|uniref:hypothetical protein n=1 Tax=Oligoflexus sp. TaxID=1971216 RepID=UPI002D35BBA9|nr:hypothetical protein [Oligoflexus sp.]HYX31827.1 hypothetical protein [Oligoflexus sp.]